MDLLQFMFASPEHFFGIAVLLIIVLVFLDSIVGSIASAFRKGK